MSQIQVTELTFGYEGSQDLIFDKVSFTIDTDWKLGFIGRNGKGKTTFLKLLLGEYEYRGAISSTAAFDYFPCQITEAQMAECCADFLEELRPDCELWRVLREMEKLQISAEVLYRPFRTLSHGERTKVMLAALFSQDHFFLLIDEPTNHLDLPAREIVKEYLGGKKGFLLVSHDRDLLDACVDHVLVLNRQTIEVQRGNFSSWQENKEKADAFHQAENARHLREIGKLRKASERTGAWADKNERTKIGFDPVKEPDRGKGTRAYIGAKTKKLQSRVTQMEKRLDREISEKEGLLRDIENPANLKVMPLTHHRELLILARKFGLRYGDYHQGKEVLRDFDFELRQGERVFLQGPNGCGKSSFLKAVLGKLEGAGETGVFQGENVIQTGILETASGLIVSCVSQDTSFLRGGLSDFFRERGLEESLCKALLRQLDFERAQFSKPMEDYSEGQKKKVLIAASLAKQAHLYLWDEPLNYVDVFSRMQIEELILRFHPTMLVVEHDARFQEKIATKVRTIFPF